jgi:hypothetical protein
MFHLAAYFLNADLNGADTALNAVLDQSLNTEDTFVRVPAALPNLVGEGIYAAPATKTRAFIRAPSLRVLANQDVSVFGTQPTIALGRYQTHPRNARPLAAQEGVEFVANTDDAAALDHVGFIWLADGSLQPTQGNIFTTRATATIVGTAGTWTLGDLNFDERLPIARYQVVGMAPHGDAGGLARLVFPGMPWRPGAPMFSLITDTTQERFRYGNWGVWGEFDLNQPPQLEIIGSGMTTQAIYLDLIQVGP